MALYQKAIIIVLVLGLGFTGFGYFKIKTELKTCQKKTIQTNSLANFLDLFINKILQAEQTVSVEDRLFLEEAVRNLNNSLIQEKWEFFTQSKNEVEAQRNALDFLQILTKNLETLE